MKDIITSGKTALGIELGSTRIKEIANLLYVIVLVMMETVYLI